MRDATLGQLFHAAGYQTFFCGKWHLGSGPSQPDQVGFGWTIAAGAAGATKSHFAPYNIPKSKGGGHEKDDIPGLDDAPEGEYLADRLTQETMKFIESHQKQPFFAVLAHYAVHTPIEAKPHISKRYQEKLSAGPKTDKEWEQEGAGENLLVQNNAEYAAMIESVDHGVGRLLQQLKKLDLEDKTIIVLASDHGGLSARGNNRGVATSNRPLRAGKGHLYEGGIRIPLLVRWPNVIRAGTEIDTPVSTLDLMPTLSSMAGLQVPDRAGRDGIDLVPLMQRGLVPDRETLYWHNPAPRPGSTGDQFSSAIRVGNLKLLEFPEEKRLELYDLSQDPAESTNLAESRPADRDRLLTKLNAWRNEVGATMEPKVKK